MFVVHRLNEAGVKAVTRIVGANLSLADDHVVGTRALNGHRMAVERIVALRSIVHFEEFHSSFIVPWLL